MADPAFWLIDSVVVWTMRVREPVVCDGQLYKRPAELEAMVVCTVLLASWGWACWFVLYIGSEPVTDSQLPSSNG